MKTNRHTKILEIIGKYPITTQDELIEYLKNDGYNVTQSTISRDIKQLRLTKSLSSDGRYRYMVPSSDKKGIQSNFQQLFSSSVISAVNALNIVVVKTYSGMAQAVCAGIDSMEYSHIVGTLAGDDTFIVICKDEKSAKEYAEEFGKYIG